MDIEGSELQALKGAKQTLSKQGPTLAISVYHNLKDLWEIPTLIKSFNPRYRFWIRNYTGYPSETILYAAVC